MLGRGEEHDDAHAPISADGLLAAVHELEAASRRLWAKAAAVEGMAESDLLALSRLVDRGAMTGVQLRTALGLSSGSVSELADRLERHGAVRRTRSGADRRHVQLRATARGRRIVGRALAPAQAELERLLDVWAHDHSRIALHAMGQVRDGLERAVAG